MQEIILKVSYFERGLSKCLNKGNSIFLSNPVPFNRQNYQRQKGPKLVTSRYSGYETSSEKFFY